MALRDVRAFDAWSVYAKSADHEWKSVRDWIVVLAERSYQHPSIPVLSMSKQPKFEVREVVVPGSGGVYIMYRHIYDKDDPVDLMSVDGFRPQDFA